MKGKYDEETWGNSGDVKYHLGCTTELEYSAHRVRLNILPNPSHLEAVNPLVYGKVKAIQDVLQDPDGKKYLNIYIYFKSSLHFRACGVIIHGDAAISG